MVILQDPDDGQFPTDVKSSIKNSKEEWQIYTVGSSFYFVGIPVNSQLFLYNLNGQLLFSKSSIEKNIPVNLNPGIYVVKVINKKTIKTQKVIIAN